MFFIATFGNVPAEGFAPDPEFILIGIACDTSKQVDTALGYSSEIAAATKSAFLTLAFQ